jgi:hypothetical protein
VAQPIGDVLGDDKIQFRRMPRARIYSKTTRGKYKETT